MRPMDPDGLLWAYSDANFSGRSCSWGGDSAGWSSCGFNDVASSVRNNGYTGQYDAVRFFKDGNYSGPSMCLSRGDSWSNLANQRWSDGSNANDSISSHFWTHLCS